DYELSDDLALAEDRFVVAWVAVKGSGKRLAFIDRLLFVVGVDLDDFKLYAAERVRRRHLRPRGEKDRLGSNKAVALYEPIATDELSRRRTRRNGESEK